MEKRNKKEKLLRVLGDGMRRNIAYVDSVERDMLREAIIEMRQRFYHGKGEDTPPGHVSW
jgi:hypothetical protein